MYIIVIMNNCLTVTQLIRTCGERLMSGKVAFLIILILSLRADVVPIAQQEPQSRERERKKEREGEREREQEREERDMYNTCR